MADKVKIGIKRINFIGEVGELMEVSLKLNICAQSSSANLSMLDELVQKIQEIELNK